MKLACSEIAKLINRKDVVLLIQRQNVGRVPILNPPHVVEIDRQKSIKIYYKEDAIFPHALLAQGWFWTAIYKLMKTAMRQLQLTAWAYHRVLQYRPKPDLIFAFFTSSVVGCPQYKSQKFLILITH